MTSNSHTFVFILVLRGYHVFTKVWKPALNEKLDCYHKFENNCDLFSQNVQIRWRYSTSFVAITFPCTSTNWMLLDHYRVNFIVSKTLLWAKDRNCPRELINCNKTVKLPLSKKRKLILQMFRRLKMLEIMSRRHSKHKSKGNGRNKTKPPLLFSIDRITSFHTSNFITLPTINYVHYSINHFFRAQFSSTWKGGKSTSISYSSIPNCRGCKMGGLIASVDWWNLSKSLKTGGTGKEGGGLFLGEVLVEVEPKKIELSGKICLKMK